MENNPQKGMTSTNGSGRKSLAAHGLVKSFTGRRVVDRVDLEVHPGEIVGLLGPN